MKKIFTANLVLCLVLLFELTSFAQFKILKDCAPGIFEGNGGPNASYATFNGKVYFTGTVYNTEFGSESPAGLWSTDGTVAGTERVKLLKFASDITNANGKLFFTAGYENDPNTHRVLWTSDGTEAGTVIVKNLSFANKAINTVNQNLLTAVGNIVYFAWGGQLWKSDGTDAGTVMVKNIAPGEFEDVNGTLFFSTGIGLWKSDGTDAGTVQVSTTTASGIINYNGNAVFRGNPGQPNDGLWISDGTTAGTVQLNSAIPTNLRVVNNKILFISGNSIWTSDGTPAGTSSVFTISTPGQGFVQMVSSGNLAYFTMNTTTGNLRELWKTDGTAAGTVKVTDLLPNSIQNLFAVVNGRLLFANTDAAVGTEVWVSDGTSGGTSLIKDIYDGNKGCSPKNFYVSGGVAYFSALDVHGQELWKTDGTAPGTSLVKDMPNQIGSSDPALLTNLNNTSLFFVATDNVTRAPNPPIGREIFKSDGTTSGTALIKDISFGNVSFINYLTAFNNKIYFSASDGARGNELWVSDGTGGGTFMVKDINPYLGSSGDRASTPQWFTVSNGSLFFTAKNGPAANGVELWKTDGTDAGTVMVKDIYPGTGDGNPSGLVHANGALYFQATDPVNGTQLWKSDGTEAGTVMVTNAAFGGYPQSITEFNGTVYFSYNNGGTIGRELFKIDPVSGSMILLTDINPSVGSDPNHLIVMNNTLYFRADNGTNGSELWKTDGTAAGTVMVKDINTGGSSYPFDLMVLNGSLYFTADDGINGRELWKSDGTAAGTVMVKNINLGTGSTPMPLAKVGFRLYFSADDGVNGREIWSTDGTTTGTNLVQDIEPGSAGSDPLYMVEVNGKLFVSVFNNQFGREVWFAPVPNDSPLPLTLLEFKGSLQNDNGVLQWKTENELNTSTFVVERSTDGRNYKSIGTVNALNTSGVNHYDYTDANIKALGASLVYYRLRQTDADNKFTYSRIVALAIDNKQNFAMLYPNPINSEINLTITLVKKQRLNWQLTDVNGRIIKNGYYDLSAGSTTLSIDMATLPAGNYFMQLNGESLKQTIRVVK